MASVPKFWWWFCENQGHKNFVLVSYSFKAYCKLHRLAFTWPDATMDEKFILASESNLSLATGLASGKVSLEPCQELEEIKSSGRGAGFWKLNTPILVNENYKPMITNNLMTWLDAGKNIHDPRLLWDWIKFNIRLNSITFSKQIASFWRKQEEELRAIACKYR